MRQSIKSTLISVLSLAALILLGIGLGNALLPLLCSFFMAYLMFPLVTQLEQKGIHRQVSVSVLLCLIIGIIMLLMVLAIPAILTELGDFLGQLPNNAVNALSKIQGLLAQFGLERGADVDSMQAYIKNALSNLSSDSMQKLSSLLLHSISNVWGLFLGLINLLLIPLFFFYIINDYERIRQRLWQSIPPKYRPPIEHYTELSNTILSGYIRGQLLMAMILALIYAFGLWLVGLPFGIVIGLSTGILGVIPYVGFIIGIGMAIIVSLSHLSISLIIGVGVVFTLAQLLENFILSPRLVGNKVGLNALTTLLALMIGANLFGILGMLLAIPLAAIIKHILADLIKRYEKSTIYTA